MESTIVIRKPDDFHCHIREGKAAGELVKFTANQFARATIMPNLRNPIKTVDQAHEYHDNIKHVLGDESSFQPLMTLYLTDDTPLSEIEKAVECNDFKIIGAKLYPAGATTNSKNGVTRLDPDAPIWSVVRMMEKYRLPLLIHGEMNSGDVFEREEAFIDNTMNMVRRSFPELKVVLEHITTAYAVDWITRAREYHKMDIAATITPHHLIIDRNDILADGLNPHNYCKPIAKKSSDRFLLRNAALSGYAGFFAGTDSAPHPRDKKECCGCAAGCFTAPNAIELYAQAFDWDCTLTSNIFNFEKFMSVNGARFFGLPLNTETVKLSKIDHKVAKQYEILFDDGAQFVVPFLAEKNLHWKLVS